MNLKKKKILAAKTFGVGLKRIKFVEPRLDEIKEALTKQDIRDLYKDGAILIKEIGGKKRLIRKKKKRSTGNVRKKVNKRKKKYVIMTRKLRKHLAENADKMTANDKKDYRKKIRNKFFASKSEFKAHIAGAKK